MIRELKCLTNWHFLWRMNNLFFFPCFGLVGNLTLWRTTFLIRTFLRYGIYLLNLRSMFVWQMIGFWQWYSMPWLLYFCKPFAPENCCTLLYFLAPQGAFWTASDGGGGVGEMEFYKPKNNIKDNISCLYLLLVLSNINDGAFM